MSQRIKIIVEYIVTPLSIEQSYYDNLKTRVFVSNTSYSHGLTQFLKAHNLVYSVPISGSFFGNAIKGIKNHLFFTLPKRVYIGTNFNQERSEIWSEHQGTLQKSSLYSLNEESDQSCSFFIENPKITQKTFLLQLKKSLTSIQNLPLEKGKINFKELSHEHILGLGTYDGIFDALYGAKFYQLTPFTHIKTNTHISTFSDAQIQGVPYQHLMFSFPHNTPDVQATTKIHAQLKEICSLRKNCSDSATRKQLAGKIQTVLYTLASENNERSHPITFSQKIQNQFQDMYGIDDFLILPFGKTIHCIVFGEQNISAEELKKMDDGTLIYNSHEHIFCESGLLYEQRLTRGITHPHSPQTILMKTTRSGAHIVDEDIITAKERHKIVFDGTINKVLIHGKTYSSKDLPSQKGTIELMEILIQHYGKTLKNSQLPSSSYSKNKNTLVGKIIAPLNTLLKKLGYEPIHFAVQGSLYEYSISLPKQHLQLLSIRKL